MKKNYLLVFFIVLSILLSFVLIQRKQLILPNILNKTNTNVNPIQDISKSDDIESDASKEQYLNRIDNSSNKNVLDLSNQNLNKLPSYVLLKTDIESLNISYNNISGALPAEIKNLQALKVLNVSNNKMTGVPAEIGQLANLEILDLSNNELTGLPYELGNLKNLKKLILFGNSYSVQDLDIIKKELPINVQIIL